MEKGELGITGGQALKCAWYGNWHDGCIFWPRQVKDGVVVGTTCGDPQQEEKSLPSNSRRPGFFGLHSTLLFSKSAAPVQEAGDEEAL